MKQLQLLLRGIAAMAILTLAVGCAPEAASVDTSTSTSTTSAAGDSVADSNTTSGVETPSSNVTGGVETPLTETPAD